MVAISDCRTADDTFGVTLSSRQNVSNLIAYLSYPFQHPDSDEVACPQVSSHGGEQRENDSSQDAKAHQPLGSKAAGQVAPRDLRQDVAVEEGAQDPALCLRVPVVHTGL